MAYEVKYRCEWTDIQQDDWKVDILEDSYAGAISAMIASGEPLTIDYLTPGDDLTLAPIKGSMATLNVECTTNFEYIGLYSEEDLVRPMNIYKNEVLYWTGWLSNEYTEPYDNVPYTVSITASDALGILKNIEYKDAGVAYTGRATETEIILEILGKIGHTTFTEYCNLYEDRMDDAVTDSPFDQAYIDNDLFIDADCYSVLQAILLKYNAVIRQKAGEFIIYRPVELIGDTVYGRIITAASTTGTSMAPDKVIDRDGLDLIDFEGGVLMYKPPMTTFTATQDYGSRESWIKNHKFDIETWQGYFAGEDRFTSWTNYGGVSPVSAYTGLSNETEGVLFPHLVGAQLVYQSFGQYAKACSDVMLFSFEYILVNVSLADIADNVTRLSIRDDAETYSLVSSTDETAAWVASSTGAINIDDATVPVGVGSWRQITLRFTGLPVDGPYTIKLATATKDDIAVGFRRLRFYSTSDDIKVKTRKVSRWKKWVNLIPPFGIIRFFGGGYRNERDVNIEDNEEIVERTYTVDNAVQGEDGKQTYTIGDVEDTGIVNVLEQYAGALAIETTGGLVQTATDFVNEYGADYTAGYVTATSLDNKVVFTSSVAGVNFTGSTTITNVSGTLSGTVATITANDAGTKQKETLDLTAGTGGDFNVTFGAASHVTSFISSLVDTATAFDTAHSAAFLTYGITVTHSGATIIFEETLAQGGFEQPIFYADPGGDMEGEWLAGSPEQIAAELPVARIDHVTLTGTSGTANILCDGVTRLATFNSDTVLLPTASWHTRGNTEAQPLAELIGDEVADMYSKGRQFVQLNMYELTESLDLLKNLQDPLNKVGANNRVFAFNRGSLNAQAREWTIDIIEIGDK